MSILLRFISSLDDSAFMAGLRRMQSGASNAGAMISGAFTNLVGVGIGAGVVALGKAAIDYAGKISDAAAATNLSVEAFQGLSFAFGQSGTKAEQFSSAIVKLQQSQLDALAGNNDLAASFERLGVSWEDLNQDKPDELLLKIAEGMSNARNPSAALADSLDVLGKGGKSMAASLREGRKAIEELSAAAAKLSADETSALDSAGDMLASAGNTGLVYGAKALLGIRKMFEEVAKIPAEMVYGWGSADMPEAAKAAEATDAGAQFPLAPSPKERAEISAWLKAHNAEVALGSKQQLAMKEAMAKAEETDQAAQERNLALTKQAARIRSEAMLAAMSDGDRERALKQQLTDLEERRLTAAEAEQPALEVAIAQLETRIQGEQRLTAEKEKQAAASERASKIEAAQEGIANARAAGAAAQGNLNEMIQGRVQNLLSTPAQRLQDKRDARDLERAQAREERTRKKGLIDDAARGRNGKREMDAMKEAQQQIDLSQKTIDALKEIMAELIVAK